MHIVDNFDTLNPYTAIQTVSRETKHPDLLYALQTFHMKQLHTKLSLKHCFMWNKNLSKNQKRYFSLFHVEPLFKTVTNVSCETLFPLSPNTSTCFSKLSNSHQPVFHVKHFPNYQTQQKTRSTWNKNDWR